MKEKIFAHIASLLVAMDNCRKNGNVEWLERHRDAIDAACINHLPHGSGIDGKRTTLDFDRSTPDRLVFAPVDFHHMDDNGFYDGWSEHTVIVTASLAFGYSIKVTGRDRRNIKDYLAEQYHYVASIEVQS